MIVLLASAVLASALLSALEAAILSVSRVRVEHGAAKGRKEASLRRILSNPLAVLLSLLLLNTLARLLGVGLLFLELSSWMGDWGYLAAFAAGLPFYLAVCELLPTALGRSFPYRFLLRMHWVIRILHVVPGWFFGVLSRKGAASRRPEMREEFQERLLGLGESGTLPRTAARLMCNLLRLRDQCVSDHCRPLLSPALKMEDPVSKLLEIHRQGDASAVPVVDNRGRVAGIADLDAALRIPEPESAVSGYIRPCPVVDPSSSLETVLCLLRNPPQRAALAASKDGALRGTVSLHDIFELTLSEPDRAHPGQHSHSASAGAAG